MKLDNIIARRANKTIYRDGEKSIKVYNLNYPKTDVLNEALNQASMEATPLNTPRLLRDTERLTRDHHRAAARIDCVIRRCL